MKVKVNHYTDDFKLKVVQEYLQTDQSSKSIMEKYNIRGKQCIWNWMRKFGLSYPTEDQVKIANQMTKESSKTRQELELEQEIKFLKKDLENEQLRTRALNIMIDIAEKELKISIRKKSGAKQ